MQDITNRSLSFYVFTRRDCIESQMPQHFSFLTDTRFFTRNDYVSQILLRRYISCVWRFITVRMSQGSHDLTNILCQNLKLSTDLNSISGYPVFCQNSKWYLSNRSQEFVYLISILSDKSTVKFMYSHSVHKI